MSLGFGFSLPALVPYGAGGNNPFNQSGPTLDLSFMGNAGNLSGADTYTLDTNFITPQYQVAAQYAVWVDGSGMTQRNFADIVTFTRASTATYFNSAGTLTTAAINEARFDFNPSTLAAQGLLIEEQRTNSIRNNTMQGAVAGTPGTLPTNWGTLVNTTTGLTTSVVGTGTENGVTYVDIRLNGTATGAGSWDIYFEPASGVAALTGQTWSGSLYWKLQAGSTTGLSAPTYYLYEFTSGVAFIVAQAVSLTFPTGAALNTQRQGGTMTLNGGATTAFARPLIKLNIANGAAIDITLRIGLPQLEQGAFATSVIPTTTTALTRSADVANVNTLAPWYNATEGTLFADLVNITRRAAVDYPRLVSLVGSDANTDEISIYTRTQGIGTGMGYGSVTAGGTNTFDPGNPATTVDSWKAAIAYKTNDAAFACSGLVTATDTSVTLPTCVQLRLFGQARFQLMPSGYLRRITYYPRRLANADLQTITA